eukprot:gnl/Chilomastix_cuspidata/2564.p4 GENE.gnl/Chilomastix_cuspidata/2564~~gnl/Chilomastix_cuspidata/2564.p4  ORF type:complete len:331 (+),score=124.19 gnl/Chilomastix_cuspidata/2564:3984-4976(+)
MEPEEQQRRGGALQKVCWLLIGQFFSLMIALGGFFSTELSLSGVNIQMGQTIPMYIGLALLLIPHRVRSGSVAPTSAFWKYLVIAAMDVMACYMTVWGYAHASVSLVSLLQLVSLPAAMLASVALRTVRYSVCNFVWAALALAGMVASMVLDVTVEGSSFLGVASGFAGAALYGVINACAELMVSACDWVEYAAFLGACAAPLTAGMSAAFERDAWAEAAWSWEAAWFLLGYLVALWLQYVFIPLFLMHVPVAILNMSFLTVGVYGLLLDTLFLGSDFRWYSLLCIAWAIVTISFFIRTPPKKSARARAAAESDSDCALLGEARVESFAL